MRHFLLRTGAAPHRLPLRHVLTFRSTRRSTAGSILIINGLSAWRLTLRDCRLKRQSTRRSTLGARLSLKRSANLSTRSPRWRLSPSARVFDRPARLAEQRSGIFANLEVLPNRNLSRSSITARGGLTFPNPLHKPPGRNRRVRAQKRAIRCAGLSHPLPSEPASASGAE